MRDRKRVLIFTPGSAGGAERMSVLIGKLLPKERYAVKYVVIGRLNAIYNLMPDDYPVDCIPVRNIYAFSTIRIWWKIVREKPDVVFVSQEAYNGRVIIASKLAGRKVIVRSSNMISKYRPSLLRQVRFTYPKADLIIAQQDEMRQDMLSILNVSSDKTITLHNPLDTKDIDRLSSELTPYPCDGSINFVNSARVCYNKSQDVAIRAFSIVKTTIQNAHLYFVGKYDEKGNYYKELVCTIKDYGLTDCVHFVGFENNPFKWVKHAHCFILPSRVEGLPNALIEASYLGVPCVAARCLEIVDEIIDEGRNGYVVQIDDFEGFAQAMINALSLNHCKMVYKAGTAEEIVRLFDDVLLQ